VIRWEPPAWPKPPPFKWSSLHEAALVILEQEVQLGPDRFIEWLEARPGATIIYLMLTEGEELKQQLFHEVRADLDAEALPDGFPATLSELLDDKGHLPRVSIAPRTPPSENGRDKAADQWRSMAGAKYVTEHPKTPSKPSQLRTTLERFLRQDG
jgi:hypothetical protein